MFTTLISKEIRRHLLTFRFAAALVTIFALVLVSVWVLADDYKRRNNSYLRSAEMSSRRDVEEVFVPSQISPTVHRPPTLLSIFAEGEDRRLGNIVRIQRWLVPSEATGSFSDNTLMAALPPFDLLTIFTVVISLFSLLFTYDAVSGEREEGTLKLISTVSIRRGTLYAAKFAAGLICIAIPFLLSFACSLVVLSFVFAVQFTLVQWAALTLMILAGLFYAAIFIALGLLSSVLVRRSSTALVLALLIWALGVLVIPGAAQEASGLLVQPPSPTEITRLESQIREENKAKMGSFYDSHPRATSGWTGGYGDDRGGYYMFDGGVENFAQTADYVRFLEPLRLSCADRIWEVFRRHELERDQQASLAAGFSVMAPAHHLRDAFTRLSGTAISSYERFMRSARRYRGQLIDGFRNRGYFGRNALRFFSRRDESTISDEGYAQRRQEYRRLQVETPTFYREQVGPHTWGPLPKDEVQPFRESEMEPDFISALVPMGALAFGTLLVFAIGFAAFIRYDVR